MKIILSRKGFDSSAGGVPSPIFPDGRMVSLPIPDRNSAITYKDISFDGNSLGHLVDVLTKGRILQHFGAHIDPDLVAESLPRLPRWRPLFGQTGAAQSHLRNNDVGLGDLFLFFGLFRRVEMLNGSYIWKRNSRPRHIIWGWLQVADVLQLSNISVNEYQWAQYHPHFKNKDDQNNVVYVAKSHLNLNGSAENLPGAGAFSFFSRQRQLTKSCSEKVSLWELPGWFHPGEKRKPLTYHVDRKRWHRLLDRTQLKSVARGQEFILDCAEFPEAIQWVHNLISGKD